MMMTTGSGHVLHAALIGAQIGVMAALASPVAAQTGCPVAADLAGGIRIDYDDGLSEVHVATAPDRVFVKGYDGGSPVHVMELAQGTHLLTFVVPDDPASLQTYDYGMQPAELPVPVAGGRWNVDVRATLDGQTRIETQSQVYNTETAVTIGDCRYRAIPVMIAYDTPDSYIELIHFLPDLGISYLVWSQDTQAGQTDPIAALRISAEPR